ncbi:MAG TPA: SDR family NAD(P)-dependent oxidoreductase [Candidatus Dormibacteraeota bacterium]|nr:SDR family NAD(P)-dependent oxidoreductase [Candidatus Dormibacteraeota bacterium]
MAEALKEAPAVTDWGPFSLKGRNALITGAAMGIGHGIAKRFAEAGANVVIADISPAIESVATELDGGRAKGIVFDVSDATAAAGAVQRVVDEFGSIDILVNNAGIYPMSPFLDMSPEFFDRVIGINLRGSVFLCKAAVAQMVKQGKGGKIVNVASIDALIPSAPGLNAYDTSKGGVLMFTKSLALEVAPFNITVNAIAPGGIITEGASKPMMGMNPQQLEAMTKEFVKQIPVGRMGAPDDIATVAVFLASPAAGYMTGTLTVVDGGRLLK